MNAMRVRTGKVRFSYAHVWEPSSFEEGQEKKYSVTLLISKKDKKTLAVINAAIEAAKKEYKERAGVEYNPKTMWFPLRDGDEDKPDNEEYEGCYYLVAKNTRKPQIVDADRDEILDKEEFYSGCYGRAIVTFFPYYKKGKGIAASLGNLQKLEDGERLGAEATKAEDDFADDDDLF